MSNVHRSCWRTVQENFMLTLESSKQRECMCVWFTTHFSCGKWQCWFLLFDDVLYPFQFYYDTVKYASILCNLCFYVIFLKLQDGRKDQRSAMFSVLVNNFFVSTQKKNLLKGLYIWKFYAELSLNPFSSTTGHRPLNEIYGSSTFSDAKRVNHTMIPFKWFTSNNLQFALLSKE